MFHVLGVCVAPPTLFALGCRSVQVHLFGFGRVTAFHPPFGLTSTFVGTMGFLDREGSRIANGRADEV